MTMQNFKTFIFWAIVAFIALWLAKGVFAIQNDNVTICHATGSQQNPYQKLVVDSNSVDGVGNGDHNQNSHQGGQDIIPPGIWDVTGRNWTTQGQAIWNNNCNVPSPTATPTVQPTATPSATPTPTIILCDGQCQEPTPTPTEEVTPTPTSEPRVTPTDTPQENVTHNDYVAPNTTATPECSDKKPGNIAWATYVASGKGEQEIRWTLPEGAETVNIRYSEVNGDWRYGAIGIPNTGHFTVKGLRSGQSYWYQIAGQHGCAAGEWSQPFDPVVL